MPAELRSAMYEVLARVPGVYLAEGKANLNGTTGLFIGEREVITKAGDRLPIGANESWSAVTTTVVDQAPAGPYDVAPQAMSATMAAPAPTVSQPASSTTHWIDITYAVEEALRKPSD